MAKRKSYNPIKMWGSWVGALIPLISLLIFVAGAGDRELWSSVYGLFGLLIIAGFLVGWGIHSAVRAIRK